MSEQDYRLGEEFRKLVEQVNALARALTRKIEKELEPAAVALQEKMEEMDWEKLGGEIREALRKGLAKARAALEEAQARLEGKRPQRSPARDEKLRILQLVAEGRISPEEGAAFLEALED